MENTIWPIKLNEKENHLFDIVKGFSISNDFEKNQSILNASLELTEILRDAERIPLSRINYFLKPACNISRPTKSRKEIFEINGIRGDDIFKHPHFIKYLIYFIIGADLPLDIKTKAEELIVRASFKDHGCDDFFEYLKGTRLIPKDNDKRDTFSEEVFKLALDSSADISDAISLRNSVKNTR